jgi:delta8-fatty-acid desaturase
MESTNEVQKRPDVVFSRRQVEGLIAAGRTIVIVDGEVLKVDAWLKYHPGGDKSIRHVVGRDATDEVNAYVKFNLHFLVETHKHSLHSQEARRRMRTYKIGRIEGRWENFVPPIQGGSFRAISGEDDAGDGEVEVEDGDISSQESSSPSSPLFEPADNIRSRRKGMKDSTKKLSLSRTSSVSSLSSTDFEPSAPTIKLSHLDARTAQEISLDLSKYPSLDANTQDHIVQEYRRLNERIRAEGLYNCNYTAYLIEACRYIFLISMSLFLLHKGWYATSAVFLGLFWHQLVFTGHDAGHMGITHDFTIDSTIGMIVAGYFAGLSIGWWKRNHNVHHIVTNSPEHDPDIEHMPFFAVSHRFLASLYSTYYNRIMTYDPVAKFTIRHQHLLYYPLLTFGRFNLYRLSLEYLILGQGPKHGPAWWHRWFEIGGQIFFWTWFGYGMVYCSIPTAWDRFIFVFISHAITMPLHLQITLSHFAMSTADLGVRESFPQKMLRTTMDVDCPPWLDFFHGGLQFQAIHHLYPRIPRHNLRRTQKLVQEFCDEMGIPYALYGFVDGNKEVIGKLRDVARQAAILAECQKSIVDKGLMSHH